MTKVAKDIGHMKDGINVLVCDIQLDLTRATCGDGFALWSLVRGPTDPDEESR